MPNVDLREEEIDVPVSEADRIRAFTTGGFVDVLVRGMDNTTWMEQLERFQQSLQGTKVRVTAGGFDFRSLNPRVGGHPVTYIPRETAEEFVRIASGGEVELVENPQEPAYLFMQFSNEIRNKAFMILSGARRPYSVYAPNNSVSVEDIRTIGGLLAEFNDNPRRKVAMRQAFQQVMQERRKAGKIVRKRREWNVEERQKFSTFVTNVGSRLKVEENPLKDLQILPRKTRASRTWGIEIEAVDIAGVDTPEYWELKGDGSLRGLHVESMPSLTMPGEGETFEDDPIPVLTMEEHADECESWDDDDCDCGYWESQDLYETERREWLERHPEYEDDIRSNTGEWVSPVLRSYHSRGLEYLTEELEPRRTNYSAGIHLHVGAKDLTAEQAIRLSVMYSALEPLFEKEYKRGPVRTYCNKVNTDEMIRRFQALQTTKDTADRTENYIRGVEAPATSLEVPGSRYWVLNLASLRSHNTIEFRAMGPVYNYEHLIRWAHFCREMVNLAAADVPQREWAKVRTFKDLVVLFSKYGKETPTPEWAKDELAEDVVSGEFSKLEMETRRVPHTRRMDPTNPYSLRIVFEDYSGDRVYFQGDRDQEAVTISTW